MSLVSFWCAASVVGSVNFVFLTLCRENLTRRPPLKVWSIARGKKQARRLVERIAFLTPLRVLALVFLGFLVTK